MFFVTQCLAYQYSLLYLTQCGLGSVQRTCHGKLAKLTCASARSSIEHPWKRLRNCCTANAASLEEEELVDDHNPDLAVIL